MNTYREDPLTRLIKKGGPSIIYSFSFEASRELKRHKLDFRYVDDHFPMSIHRTVDELAKNLAVSWGEPFGEGLHYRKVDLSALFSRDLAFYFKDCIKCFSVASTILRDRRPIKVFCSPPIPYGRWEASNTMPIYTHLPQVLEVLCKAKGIQYEVLDIPENDQVFSIRREERLWFDLAVKSRNMLLEVLKKGKVGGRKRGHRVLTVMLKKGIFNILDEMANGFGIDLLVYNQASDLPSFKRRPHTDAISDMKERWMGFREDGRFLTELHSQMDPVIEMMAPDFEYLFDTTFPEIMSEVDRFYHVLENWDIDFLLCAEDFSPLAKTRVATAQVLGVPVGVVQHGFQPKDWEVHYTPPVADHNFIWGPGFIDIWQKEGYPKERMIVTGITSVDIIFNRPAGDEEQEKVRQKLGIPADKRLILFITNPAQVNYSSRSLRDIEDEILGVFSLLKDREEVMVTKLHPREKVEFYEDMAKEVGYEAIVTKEHLVTLLSMCDVLLSTDSTVGLQGLMLGKPMVLINTHEVRDIYNYVECKVAEPAFTIDDLPKALDKVLYGGPEARPSKRTVEAYLEMYATNRDGSGVKNIIKEIARIITSDGS